MAANGTSNITEALKNGGFKLIGQSRTLLDLLALIRKEIQTLSTEHVTSIGAK